MSTKISHINFITIDTIVSVVLFNLAAAFIFHFDDFFNPKFFFSVVVFSFAWLFASLIFRKFQLDLTRGYRQLFFSVLASNVLALFVLILLYYTSNIFLNSRVPILFSIVFTSFFDLFFIRFLNSVAKESDNNYNLRPLKSVTSTRTQSSTNRITIKHRQGETLREKRERILMNRVGFEPASFISQHIDLSDKLLQISDVISCFNLESLPESKYSGFVFTTNIFGEQKIMKMLNTINKKLTSDGFIVGRTYTHENRIAMRDVKTYTGRLRFYVGMVYHHILSQIPVFDLIYKLITKKEVRAVSKTECLGRLFACGFRVRDVLQTKDALYFVADKISEPLLTYDKHYGPLLKQRRVGKDGKEFNVYKFRTMYPYSEYLQAFIYETNKLREGGKIKDDYRIFSLGRWMRKLWIDELPMFYNILKGELKFVGVRPVSSHYFSLYSTEFQKKRILVKPGLIPPFYYDLPKTLSEIQSSEEKYIDSYLKDPLRTDLRYFFGAVYNILIKGVRSN